MSIVTLRNTKHEIMAAYETQAAILQSGPTWGQVASKIASTVSVVSSEIALAVSDCHAAGRQARVWYNQIMAELSRPLIKS